MDRPVAPHTPIPHPTREKEKVKKDVLFSFVLLFEQENVKQMFVSMLTAVVVQRKLEVDIILLKSMTPETQSNCCDTLCPALGNYSKINKDQVIAHKAPICVVAMQ